MNAITRAGTMRLRVACAAGITGIVMLNALTPSHAANTGGSPQVWQERLAGLAWVAYSPPSANPQQGTEATADDIRQDVSILQRAKFTGLVTYACSGVMGTGFARTAQETGFKGLIMGIWDPGNQQEIGAAVAAASNPIVLGYCVGNEGLPEKGQTTGRYTLEKLTEAIQSLRTLTGKPVTTAEQYGDYSDERLLKLGDWVFPTVHPYFYHVREPLAAVKWTKDAYDDLRKRSGRLVLFKEVGLPTAGDEESRMSEAVQEKYYAELAKTDVKFVYFEAFDQPWKTHLSIEPHWGIFKADRTPKLLAARLLGEATTPKEDGYFYIYDDADSNKNHFTPSGYMGDINDIQMDDQYKQNPHSGSTCIRVVYTARGRGPGTRPAGWAGVYWQRPPKNWGTNPEWKGRGYDLSGYVSLTFWARADRECEIEFKVGGITGPYGDSLKQGKLVRAKLGPNWHRHVISVKGANLKHIIGGFCWTANREDNPEGATFYLDDIRFEKR